MESDSGQSDRLPLSSRHPVAQWAGILLAAIPCFYLSYVLFSVWADPMAHDNGTWVRFGVGLMLLEFVLLHSGAFMGAALAIKAPGRRLGAFAILVFFYGLMVWAFAVALNTPGLMWVYALIVLGRLVTAVLTRGDNAGIMAGRSAVGVVFYLFVVFGTVFIPVPEWGITPAVLDEVYPQRGGGLWEEEPQRAVAGAAIYFLLIGLAEVFLLGPGGRQIAHSDKPPAT